MPFEELVRRKRLNDPSERESAEIIKSNKKSSLFSKRLKSTSVSLTKTKVFIAIIKIVFTAIIFGAVGYAAYHGINLYIGG